MSAPAASAAAVPAHTDAGKAHKGRTDQFEYLTHYHTTTHDMMQKIDMNAPVVEPSYTELEVQQMEELRKTVGEMVNDPKLMVATADDYPAGMHQHWTHAWPAGKDSAWFVDKYAEAEKEASQWPQHELIRFLRARDYKMKKCVAMYFHYKRWRILFGATHIGSFPQMPWEPLITSILSHSYHKWDKHGRPIYMQRSGLIDPDRFAREVPLEVIGVGHTWFTEEMTKRLEIGSRMTGKRVTTLVNIIDIAKVGLGARKMLKIFATTSYIDQNFYPEELGCMYLINAPSFFPVLYSICKGFLSQKTQEKIRILGSNYAPVLVEELGADCLPEEYGGTCKCEGEFRYIAARSGHCNANWTRKC